MVKATSGLILLLFAVGLGLLAASPVGEALRAAAAGSLAVLVAGPAAVIEVRLKLTGP